MKLSAINIDVSKIEAGAWTTARILGNDQKVHELQIRMRGTASLAYQRDRAAEIGKLNLENQNEPTEADLEAISAAEGRAMARSLVFDWVMTNDAGERVPYDPQEASEVLSRPGARFLRNGIEAAGNRIVFDGKDTYEALLKK